MPTIQSTTRRLVLYSFGQHATEVQSTIRRLVLYSFGQHATNSVNHTPLSTQQYSAAADSQMSCFGAGALEYGCNPDLIHARCSRLAYGIEAARRSQPGDPQTLQILHPQERYIYTGHVFQRYVKRGQLVEVDDVVEHGFLPLYDNQSGIACKLYATDNNTARFTIDSDMQELASVHVELPDGYDRNKYGVTLQLHFGRTELIMVAVDDQTGQKLRTTTKFAHSRVPLR